MVNKDNIRLHRVVAIDWPRIDMEFLINGKKVSAIYDMDEDKAYIGADDTVRFLGLGESLNDYFVTDKGLDFLSDWLAQNPGKKVEEDMTVLDLFRSV